MTVWIEPQEIEVPDAIRALFPTPGDLGTLAAGLLVRRGITDVGQARAFLDPRVYVPAPPEALPDLAETVERLVQALSRREPIAVWGDFDVDGQTATALYVQALRSLEAEVTFTIPSRRESHGVHEAGVQALINQGVRLILTGDTGIAAHAAVERAARQGVEVLVTDHHDLPEALPDARTVVNPKRLPADHVLYDLPGVGVAYQVVRGLYEHLGRGGDAVHFLDLVALGIVADVATVRADVRYLLQCGLDVLRSTERPGLQAVMALAGLKPALLSAEDIGFALAPRLNAISRVGQEMGIGAAVELLTTEDRTRARTIATALEALNARRRWLTRQTYDAALSQLERDRALAEGPAIVVSGAAWDPGIVGIVAGRLAERFNKPAVVLSAPPGEMARGSARSVEGVDIHAAIAAQKHLLHRCGGHPMAAGLSLDGTRIDAFRRALWRTLEQTALPPAEREIQIDAVLSLEQISLELAQAVERLAPFGQGNERPVLATSELTVAHSAVVGRTREHRRVVVRDVQQREQTIMWWRSMDQEVPEGRFDLAYTVGINTFRGQPGVQLTWVDARSVSPPPVRVAVEPLIEVVDRRGAAHPLAALRTLLAASAPGEKVWVWGEGPKVREVPLHDRGQLRGGDVLFIWTAPPDPAILSAALQAVSPRRVVLLGVDPGLDTPRAFSERLGGLVKYALRRYGGQASLAALAAAMAHGERTVALGLRWMGLSGRVDVSFAPGGQVVLRPGTGAVRRDRDDERLPVVEGRLRARLEEAAAYRDYFRQANKERVIQG